MDDPTLSAGDESPSLELSFPSSLADVDSPTVANAIERFAVRDRAEGYVDGSVRCRFPDQGTVVGRAITLTADHRAGAPPGREGYERLLRVVADTPGPTIIVAQDRSPTPGRCAYFGELMAAATKRLGAVGFVTDGGVRDIDEVGAQGFAYFSTHVVVSHGNWAFERIGEPVEIGGQRIVTGDLLHMDRNGIVIVPDEVLTRLPDEIAAVRRREAAMLARIRSPQFLDADARDPASYL